MRIFGLSRNRTHDEERLPLPVSVTLRTTVDPWCDVIQNTFSCRVGVHLHLHGVHILVCLLFAVNYIQIGVNDDDDDDDDKHRPTLALSTAVLLVFAPMKV